MAVMREAGNLSVEVISPDNDFVIVNGRVLKNQKAFNQNR